LLLILADPCEPVELSEGNPTPMARALRARRYHCVMVDETLARLEAETRQASVPPEEKAELLRLIAMLRAEIGQLANTHADQAKSIAGFAQVSAYEATRPEQRPELVKLSLAGLEKSVEEFKATHPRLVEIVGGLSTTLSNMGL
jgi:hypothetical protein